jgi:3-oxoacyl-ACP reductase-like protein
MSYIAAGVMAGLSLAGSASGNKAISAQASRQYEANKMFIDRDRGVLANQIGLVGIDVNSELGAKLSSLGIQAEQLLSATAAGQAESNVYGNSARRAQLAIEMQRELSADNLEQAAESKMLDVQKQFTQAMYDFENKSSQNLQAYENTMSQQKTALDMATGALSAGISGYTAAQSLKAGGLANETLQTRIEALKADYVPTLLRRPK